MDLEWALKALKRARTELDSEQKRSSELQGIIERRDKCLNVRFKIICDIIQDQWLENDRLVKKNRQLQSQVNEIADITSEVKILQQQNSMLKQQLVELKQDQTTATVPGTDLLCRLAALEPKRFRLIALRWHSSGSEVRFVCVCSVPERCRRFQIFERNQSTVQ
jgi:hypothetical protein